MGELQTLLNMITNVMMLQSNGKVLTEEEYLFYTSCLQSVKAHNRVRKLISTQNFKALNHAIKLDKTIEQDSSGTTVGQTEG